MSLGMSMQSGKYLNRVRSFFEEHPGSSDKQNVAFQLLPGAMIR